MGMGAGSVTENDVDANLPNCQTESGVTENFSPTLLSLPNAILRQNIHPQHMFLADESLDNIISTLLR